MSPLSTKSTLATPDPNRYRRNAVAYRLGIVSRYTCSNAVGAVSKTATPWGGSVTSIPAVSSPPRARRSAISASAITWLPPIGMGQPTLWARVASISPAPADTSEGSDEIAWAATPVNNARASSPASPRHAGVPCARTRRPRCMAGRSAVGTDRLSPSSKSTAASQFSTSGLSKRFPGWAMLEFGAGLPQIAVGDRRWAVRQRVGIGDVRHGQPHAPGGQIELEKNGDASASGCTAEHTSCRTPGNSKSAAVREPPPKVCWASMTCTLRPARAQITAAVNPLGPLPTTVTSTP